MENNMLNFKICSLKEKHKGFDKYKDYQLFTILCMKYFFYDEANLTFDYDNVDDYLTDGSNDGGIDAIINDQSSENNDVIIIQSKYYNKCDLSSGDILGELHKIKETIKNLRNYKVATYNEKVVTAFKDAASHIEESGSIRVYLFTSYLPKNKKERNKLEKTARNFINEFDVEIVFKDDIEAQIEMCDNGKLCVDHDKIELDKKDNYLEYEDSIIVNISARSLQELQNRRRNGLLGKNLRYYVKKKDVDDGIENTIKKEPQNFWYKNNGILVICDDYEIDGKILKLYNFSIVNGGQTTNRIGKSDIEQDFYLQCKVVKAKGKDDIEKNKFVYNIAESTNSQKPIKKSDLKANSPEQLELRERLSKYHVYYITKKGDKVPKQYSMPYEKANLEQVGKLGLASILQMPGSSRSNSQRMYNEAYYPYIFGYNAKEGVIADVLRISYYYDKFSKTKIKNRGYDEKTTLPMMKNGKTFQIASIVFLSKIRNQVFDYSTVSSLFTNTDDLKDVLKTMGNMSRIILNKKDNEEEIFYQIFDIIGDEVLGYCYDNALDEAEKNQKSLAPSDYLKSDNTYYKHIIKRLWKIYNKKELKSLIDTIM